MAASTREKARAGVIELLRQKIKPTPTKLRDLIGGGGTDLLRSVIKEVEDELYEKQFNLANRPDVPPEIIDKTLSIWNRCNDLADERYAVQKATADRLVADAERGRQETQSHCVLLEEKASTLQAELLSKTGEASALRTALETAEARAASLLANTHTLQSEMGRVRAEADTRIAAADNRVLQIEAQANDQARLAEERYEGLRTQLLNNFDREKTGLQRQISDLTDRLAVATDELATQRHELHENDVQLRQLTGALSEAKGRLMAVEEERTRLSSQVAIKDKKLAMIMKRKTPAKR